MGKNEFRWRLGDTLRWMRKSRHLTQYQLAEKVSQVAGEEISLGTIGAWERGERPVSAERLLAIMVALDYGWAQIIELDPRATDCAAQHTIQLILDFIVLPEPDREVIMAKVAGWGQSH